GIPKQRNGVPALPDSLASCNALGLTLTYEGKRSLADVLLTPPAELERLWPVSSVQTSPNTLYFGDNLPVLTALCKDPTVYGQVRLVYIDPPYATGGNFQSRTQQDAYEDLLLGAHYIEF